MQPRHSLRGVHKKDRGTGTVGKEAIGQSKKAAKGQVRLPYPKEEKYSPPGCYRTDITNWARKKQPGGKIARQAWLSDP